ncbi:MAG TPA: hypothetical protein VE088_07735 [Gaiellaceae bacterium]|jgi:hypothetical protein|nr:hypothetical protein [Gaiellaceae bacterium]
MGSRSATELLQLAVRLHGIRLGQPTDLLLDVAEWRALGLVVLCGDAVERFLAFAAAETRADEIAVGSALLLLEDVDFYRARSRSLRGLLGGTAERAGRELGAVRDLVLAPDGAVEVLVVERDGRRRTSAAEGVTVAAARASAA